MKNRIKKSLSLLLAVIMLVVGLPMTNVVFDVGAESGEYSEGYYTYTVENEEATITDCDNDISGDVVIPDTLGGYQVSSIGSAAFCDCTGLTSIKIPDSVTSIGDSAFDGCFRLTSVTIPDVVTYIGESAFCDCSSLTSINIPDGVTSIGEYTFYCCNSLASISIPDSITSVGYCAFDVTEWYDQQPQGEIYIGKVFYEYKGNMPQNTTINIKSGTKCITSYAFHGCTGLSSITIPDSVTSIGEHAFYRTSLTSVSIPEGVTSINDYTFYGCSSLKNISIPDSITTIGEFAFDETEWHNKQPYGEVYIGKVFYEYKGNMPQNTTINIKSGTKCIASSAFGSRAELTSITIPNSTIGIGKYAFDDCTGLTSIIIPDNVTDIGDYAFSDCTALKNIYMSVNVKSIGNCVFNNCTSLANIKIPNSVTSIGDNAFCGCTSLASISIPDDVTSIGDAAFANCIRLTEIIIPDNVKEIGKGAFAGCTGLSNVTIGENVVYIHESAFGDCVNLKEINWNAKSVIGDSSSPFIDSGTEGNGINVIFSDEVKNIPQYAFGGVSMLKSVMIGKNVKRIDYQAFWDTGLTEIDLPESLTYIGVAAFSHCTELKSITIPASVTYIGYYAFSDCENLSNFNLFGKIDGILERTFENCKNLTSINLPDSVTHIDTEAFFECRNLKNIKMSDRIVSIGYSAFENCTGLSSIKFTNSLKSIGEYAFWNCSGLTDIELPNSLIEIGQDAFYNCTGLTNITIPDSLTSIDVGVFGACTGLTSVIIPNSITAIGKYAFYDCYNLSKVKIPESVKSIGNKAFGYNDAFSEYKTENFKIYGFANTAAETYANENEFVFVPIPDIEAVDELTNIHILYSDKAYSENIKLNVSPVTSGDAMNALNAEKGKYKKMLFDITPTINGEKVQPNAAVFVKIPIPDGYDYEKTAVYNVTDDGKIEKMESNIENNYIVFETNHFSYYAIVDESAVSSATCSCNCHKSGIAHFFFKIILFFQKLFKQNKLCKCGVAHY